jgi:hypothetical protein
VRQAYPKLARKEIPKRIRHTGQRYEEQNHRKNQCADTTTAEKWWSIST